MVDQAPHVPALGLVVVIGAELFIGVVLMIVDVFRQMFAQMRQDAAPKTSAPVRYCSYPECNCPFDAPGDNWCLYGYPHKREEQ